MKLPGVEEGVLRISRKAVSYLSKQLGIRIRTHTILIQDIKMISYKTQTFQILSDHEERLLNR
jgi:hypothetical protein